MRPIELAARLDADDPLASWRDQFQIDDPDLSYLDGNSLGMLPKRTVERVNAFITDEWGRGLIRGWDRWIDLPRRVGDLPAPLIGARSGEVVVHDSTTVNLYQLIRAALRMRPDRKVIAVDPDDFPTDRYVVGAIAEADGLTVRAGFEDLDDIAVAVRSMVDFRNAAVTDIAAETRHARRITALLAGAHRVLADFREPDVIRLGCSPLTTRFADVARATVAIAQLTS